MAAVSNRQVSQLGVKSARRAGSCIRDEVGDGECISMGVVVEEAKHGRHLMELAVVVVERRV